MHRETARTAVDCEPDTWQAEAQELLDKLNKLCSAHEGPPYYREDNINLGEFIQARQYLSLLDHAEDVFKAFHELLNYSEGTAGDNRGKPWPWIEIAKAVLFKAEGNT